MSDGPLSSETYRGRAIAVHRDVVAPDPGLAYVASVDGVLLCERPRAVGDVLRVLHFATPEAARVAAQRHVRAFEPS